MQRIAVFLLALALAGCSVTKDPNYVSRGDGYGDRVTRKTGRGLANIVTAPLEIPNQSVEAAGEGQNGAEQMGGYLGGAVIGVFYGVGRVVSGTFDVATAAFSGPSQPSMDPEFIHSGFIDSIYYDDDEYRPLTIEEFMQRYR